MGEMVGRGWANGWLMSPRSGQEPDVLAGLRVAPGLIGIHRQRVVGGDLMDRPAAVVGPAVDVVALDLEDGIGVVGLEERGGPVEPGHVVALGVQDLEALIQDPVMGPVAVAVVPAVGPSGDGPDRHEREGEREDEHAETDAVPHAPKHGLPARRSLWDEQASPSHGSLWCGPACPSTGPGGQCRAGPAGVA
jgi:hypothetical protein